MSNPSPIPHNANVILEGQLDERVEALELELQADVLMFCGPLSFGVDDYIRDAVERRVNRKDKLVVLLETEGGYAEVAERIARVFRTHYKAVEFLIPNYAMSAGTILVMCGDAIHMDYYSVLGPIDPQVQRPGGGGWIPALGYLVQYERLMTKSRKGKKLSTAEISFLVAKFDPAELYRYEQERELSISLLEKWLVTYKFKTWGPKTKTHKKKVTPAMKKQRAREIASALNETDRWHSHGRGISREVLVNDLNLEIEDFGVKPTLNEKIRTYYRLLNDYMIKRNHVGVIHTHGHYEPFLQGG